MDDLPFWGEYAKSNRASCKGCKNLISKDTLRLAVLVQSPHFDGKIPNWYHPPCFFKKTKVKNHIDIKDFDTLRWDDQESIKKSIASGTGAGRKSGGASSDPLGDYLIEYAKSNRSKCRVCDDKINTKTVRISVKDYDSQRAKQYGVQDRWHHVDCFARDADSLIDDPTIFDITKVSGFASLKPEDQEELKSKVKVSKKRKASDDGDTAEPSSKKAKKSKEEAENEAKLKSQSEILWKIRDQLSKSVKKNALIGLLEFNDQKIPTGESALLDRVSDAMAFGPLKPCTECEGQLAYSAVGYCCTGMATEWTKCLHRSQEPPRGKFKVPEQYGDVDYLKKFKFVKRVRVFPKNVSEAAHTSIVTSAVGGGQSAARPDKPLSGMKFVVTAGAFASGRAKSKLEGVIREMGGLVSPMVGVNTAALIGTEGDVKAQVPLVANAKKFNVHVVNEDFLAAAGKGGAALLIETHSVCDWGSPPLTRIGAEQTFTKSTGKSAAQSAKTDKAFSKHAETMKLKVKGGAAVDPDSELADSAHILKDPDSSDPLNAILNMVDLVRGTNSYYKLQALESDSGTSFYVFRSWGRTGTSIGGNKLERFYSARAAAENFTDLYLEKTGNAWTKRKNFEKRANKFFPLELDFGSESEDIKVDMSKTKSKLDKAVQDLIRFIFDVESMKATMLEFEIDLKKMPLGKLSRGQIDRAYTVLKELITLVETGGTMTKFLDASTRFYTLIPHDFGTRKPPVLDTEEVIQAKVVMLDNLVEIEVAYSLMKGAEVGADPIDAHYAKLTSKLTPIDKSSEEYKRIVDYVDKTHAPTHTNYKLRVDEIFEVQRSGESGRYKAFKKMHNKMLLWHGSRRTNWAGILSQGLRIAPPEAPVTGYMFGKGIYFADMVSKSANYCFTSRSMPESLLLLSEVALGNMAERTQSDSSIKLKAGEHSCKGIGRTFPSKQSYYTNPEGVVYPIGKPNQTSIASSLLYNEYIVYDIAQVKQKYLLRVTFDYT